MRKMKIALALSTAPLMMACPGPYVPPPSSVADHTRMDEVGRTGIGLAYVTASRLGNALSQAGGIDRAAFQSLDNRGYAVLLRVRAAYAAGNSDDYQAAVNELKLIIEDINNLVGR